ncbi:hypothetical protein TorRG33x02_138920, partial [Trema orientale]
KTCDTYWRDKESSSQVELRAIGHIQSQINEARQLLEAAQNLSPSEENILKEREVNTQLKDLVIKEELM